MQAYERTYARVLGTMAVVGFALLLVSTVVTIFELMPTMVGPEEWQALWAQPAEAMRERVVSTLELTPRGLTAEGLGFVAVGFFGIATAVSLVASIPLFFAKGRPIFGVLGLLQLLVYAVAIWVIAG
jgi:hypothetical protein